MSAVRIDVPLAKASRRYAVIAGGELNGLGIARSLARAGIPTVILDDDLTRPTMRTRHGQKRQVEALEGAPFLAALAALRREVEADPVLFLTQEKSVATVSENYAAVSRGYRISMPDASLMRTLMDKAGFQGLAERLGYPIARAVTLSGEADLAAARTLRFPCVLKPLVKSAAYDARFKKAYKVEGFAEAERLFREIRECATTILQEWIEGGDDAIYFCLQFRSREQAPVASFVGRKLRSWPPRIGGTASCMAAFEAAPELERLTNGFFSDAGFFGMGSMEYKKDTRTGGFFMIEPTVGRTDFQEEVATLSGINIPVAAYCHEAGERWDAAVSCERPAAWVVSQIDRWSRGLQPDNKATIPNGVRRYDAIRRLGDPLPWLHTLAERLRDRFAARK
jgi:D-aspartate ligase